MRRMGIKALYRKKNTSKRHPEHAIYPYLLRYVAIERANQVWALDITYIPMHLGFVYFVAVMDWASRRIEEYFGFEGKRTQSARCGSCSVSRPPCCNAAILSIGPR
jgi:transposase InsO family protein